MSVHRIKNDTWRRTWLVICLPVLVLCLFGAWILGTIGSMAEAAGQEFQRYWSELRYRLPRNVVEAWMGEERYAAARKAAYLRQLHGDRAG